VRLSKVLACEAGRRILLGAIALQLQEEFYLSGKSGDFDDNRNKE
jgi:hypothetical protein